MNKYSTLSKIELEKLHSELIEEYKGYQKLGMNLNMSRGKPSSAQLDLCADMLDVINSKSDCKDKYGTDARNYGELAGLKEARELFGEYLGVTADETIVVGSSSLTFMYDCMVRAMLTGVLGSERPWGKEDKVKFLCPVPGYDRHFRICEFLGIEMINIQLDENGPDMDLVEKLVGSDPQIKGMWCIPKYGNPTGWSFSDETVRRLASMKTAAKDFRLFWDNAYGYHYLYNKNVEVLNILDECKKAGNPNRVYMFASTSKITYAGAGVGFFGASKENVDFTLTQIGVESISWDKMNMLRHVRYFKDMDGIRKIMDVQNKMLLPKFDMVISSLEREIGPVEAGSWIKPDGGYFITFFAHKGCAKRTVQLCKEAGLTMTDAGCAHPYHKDPDDSLIRIAPSLPPLKELEDAMKVFCVSVKLAYVEKLLAK